MKLNFYRFWQDQKRDWQEFSEIMGLKMGLKQMAAGAAFAILFLLLCGIAEWLESL